MTLEEILSITDIGQKITYLKKGRKTELPDRCKLWDDWNPQCHEIMVDKKKYPDSFNPRTHAGCDCIFNK